MRLAFLLVFLLSFISFAAVLLCQLSSWPAACAPLEEAATYLGSGSLQLAILSLALFFLWKNDLQTTLSSLGFPGTLRDTAFYSFMCVFSIFLVLFVLGAASILLGFNDQQKVSDKIVGLPLPMLFLAAFAAPIGEEIFFRGLLASRFGVMPSSLVFGLMHFAYGSTIEILGAFFIGAVLAMTYKVSRSITPCIVAHILYNALAIAIMRMFA